ncbi:PREDICTED: kelch-like protein 8 [Priapulus caudatus]|uniref:Kelch-like protein 8 n=1 Tax=Priapulus caudatus TaxID=37621 RepID=A0ABM1DRV1_PRICU|nr:PREDICTED: kelch-like protein 8 [Priapulus caudatus]
MSASATAVPPSRLVIVITLVSSAMGDQLFKEEEVDTSQYVFEHEQYGKHAFATLYELYKSHQLCDVTLQVGSKSIACHRVVLACCSRYFHVMFTSEMSERHSDLIPIKDIDESAMEALVEFAYTGRIALGVDSVQSVFYAASVLQLEVVCCACARFMIANLHASNCLGIRAFAEQHNHAALIAAADAFACEHFVDVALSEEFLNMSAMHLVHIIRSDDLNSPSEIEVYEAVMRWMGHDPSVRKKFLSIVLGRVRLPLLPAHYIMHVVELEELLKKDHTCRDYLDEAKNYQLVQSGVVTTSRPHLGDRTKPRKSYAGVIFCVGGRGASGDPFRSIECYNLRCDTWVRVTDMSTRRRHVGVVAAGGKLYAIGGHDGKQHLSSGEVFDPQTGLWKALACMASQRRGIAVGCLGGPIYAVGGLDDNQCYNAVERYDFKSDQWSFVASMNYPRGGVGVAALKGLLYACGGNDGMSSLSSCECYDPHLNKWTEIAPMHTRRAGAGVTVLSRHLYVLGGFDDNAPLASVERYDTETNSWSDIASMSSCRGGVGVATLSGRIYAVGGHDGSQYLDSVEAYDAVNDSWELVCSISTCRAGAGVAWCEVSVRDLHISNSIVENTPVKAEPTEGEEIRRLV